LPSGPASEHARALSRSCYSARPVLYTILVLLFGDPRAIMAARVLSTLAVLCPCAPADDGCHPRHVTVARTIAIVAEDEGDAALLLGIGAHETGFRVLVQARGGPAVSWWQLEVPRRDRAALLADPVAAARRALGIARRGFGTYACGNPHRCADAAAELRRYVEHARGVLSRM